MCRAGTCYVATAAALKAALGTGGPVVVRLCPNTVYQTDSQGPFTIARNLLLIGAAGAALERGASTGEVIVEAGATATELRSVVIRNGVAGSGGGTVLLEDSSSVTSNQALGDGGGIINQVGNVHLTGTSRVALNTADGRGDGIFNEG